MTDLSAGNIGTSASSAPKPVATIPQLASYLTVGFWQYAGTIAHHWGTSTITYNIEGLNAAEKFLAQSALNAWHDVTNLTFVQTSGTANITYTHTGSLTAYEYDYYSGSGIISSAYVNISADWITTDGGAYDGKTGIDSYGYQTYIHETGHALGLGHQGPYNGSASYASGATYANDTWQYSVMSYFGQHNYNGSSYRYVITPQIADIYAVQSVYGASTTRTGDTVYGFNTNAGAVYNFVAYSQVTAFTIYDSGGNDTLDASGYGMSQTIDLRPGNFSSIGGLVNNIGIYSTSVIEVAIGGSGNDTLIASNSGSALIGGGGADMLVGGSGNDRLVGGSGRDVMTGGTGSDTFVFALSDSSPATGQHDWIADFVSGVDFIDLSAIDAIAGTGTVDAFIFLSNVAFGGNAGELNYLFDSSRNTTVVQGDVNGDRAADFAIDLGGNLTLVDNDFYGVVLTRILESVGSTSLTQVGSHYYLNNSGGSGPELTFFGSPVTAGQFSPWTFIAAERVTSGYAVALKSISSNQYVIWNTDSSASYVSNSGVLSPTDTALMSFETTFLQDFNADGTVGFPTRVLEAVGSTRLTQVGNNYYLYDGSGSGPELTFFGSPVMTGQFGPWGLVAAEQVSGGYVVALQSGSQFVIWNTDSSGDYQSNSGVLSTIDNALISFETSFQQDLNGDGTVGFPIRVLEAVGSTSLTQIGSNYYLRDGSGSGPELTFFGSPVRAGQFSPFAVVAAEQMGGGYAVALQTGSQFVIWNTDSSGSYQSNSGVLSVNDNALISFETSFQQDLNGDGTVGFPTRVLEAVGSTSLTQIGSNYYLRDGSGSGPELTFFGSPVTAGQFSPFNVVAAEQVSGGYTVALKSASTNQFVIWNTDTSANYVSNSGVLSATDNALISSETSFHQDLNGDGMVGFSARILEAVGATTLAQVGNNYFLQDNTGSGPQLTFFGTPVTAGQFSPFTFIAAEQVSGGYDVALKSQSTNEFVVWHTDTSANYQSNSGVLSAKSSALFSFENSFHQDLNGDGTVGLLTHINVADVPISLDQYLVQSHHSDFIL